MDSPFEKLDPETREEWLENPTTRAFFRSIAAHRQDVVDQILDQVKGGHEYARLASMGGELRALDFYTVLVTKE